MRLRRTNPRQPGWSRRRAGRGFAYYDEQGERLSPDQVARVRALVIPPAWTDVWISPFANGHLQAVGTDAAGRRQYLYHEEWRRQRDIAKFDRVLLLGQALPKARERLRSYLAEPTLTREFTLAVAVRLLDLGYFRIGTDVYADERGSYGLTTLERRHVRRQGACLRFQFVGKSGVEHVINVDDPIVCEAVGRMRRRRGGGRLLAWKNGRVWRDVDAADVNDFLGDLFAVEVTAKDFRTWHGTVIAASALSAHDPARLSRTARTKAVRAAVREVATYLGNTTAVARSSYIDPRVIDLFEDGVTITRTPAARDEDPDSRRDLAEQAVLRLLTRPD